MRRKAISLDVKRGVWSMTDGRCWYCGWQCQRSVMDRSPFSWEFRVDHLVPVIAGGSDDPSNLRPSCVKCNGRKKGSDIETFRATMTRLFNQHKPEEEHIDRYVFWFEDSPAGQARRHWGMGRL